MTTIHILKNYTGENYCGAVEKTIQMRGRGDPNCAVEWCDCMEQVNCESCILLYFQDKAENNI